MQPTEGSNSVPGDETFKANEQQTNASAVERGLDNPDAGMMHLPPIESARPTEPVPAQSVELPPRAPIVSTPQQTEPTIITSAPEKPKIKERVKQFFAKTNTHYKRNRVFAMTTALLVAGVFVFIGLFASGRIFGQASAIKILDVTPTDIDGGIIKNNTKFVVTAENGSIEKVRNAVYLEPAIDYQINEQVPGQQYEIVPSSALPDNMVLNIDSVSNEVIDYKWAFQTKKDLSVSKIYPANGANYVSENSVIEISFSYPDVDGLEDHFKITPSIGGTLEKLDRTWRFTPANSFASNTTYEITITKGLAYGEETMTEDFHSSFSTFAHVVASSGTKNEGITLDGVSTFTESEKPIVVFDSQDRDYFQNADHITIEKYATADDYISHLKGNQATGEEIGDYTFEKIIKQSSGGFTSSYTVLNQTLPTGYYTFHFKSSGNQNLYAADIEINNLAAYAFESQRDMVVWVAEDGELKSGINVKFKNKDYTTGSDGLLKVENISDYSGDLDYLKIGNTDQPLVLALTNYRNTLFPRGFIYTDRPLYKSTDTIKVWGYVPLKFFKDAPNRNGFSLAYDTIKQPVEVDENGFFNAEIVLENYKDCSESLELVYNDQEIAWRYIEVEDYSLENYIYEYVADKNYIKSGENINFKVKVSHVTGFPAANKDIVVTYDGHDYYGTTNGQGEASFSLPTSYQVAGLNSRSSYDTKDIEIKSGGADYNKYSNYTTIYIFKNSLDISYSSDKTAGTVTFEANNLDLSRQTKTYYGLQDLVSESFSGPATITFYEDKTTRWISYYQYNEYTKENEPVYRSDTTSNAIGSVAVDIVNGSVTYSYPDNMKDPEEDVRYTYYAVLSTTDADGRPAYSFNDYYYQNDYLGEEQNYGYHWNAIEALDYNPFALYNNYYSLYRFGLKDRDYVGNDYIKKYSVGDHLTLGLYDYAGENVKNSGTILAISYQESVINTNVFTSETLDLEFDRSMYPGANIVGAYFIDGKFHRVAPAYRDYDTEDSRLTIMIETDKESYSPGETVKAKVVATRPDGSRVNGKINLSVVNEAIFNAYTDDTRLLESIYSNKTFPSYAVSTFRDYELEGGGGLGSAGGGRADFGDTIFFGEKTLSNGEAEFEFKLNDSITSFRLTALVVENADIINAGVGTANISSYLPLSITTTMPKKVKNTDDLVLNARSIISSGNSIEYTFTVEELGQSQTATAAPGQMVNVNFGKLSVGSYTVTISARDSAGNEDKMVYPIEIIETAQEVAIKKTVNLSETAEITPSKNPVTVEVYNSDTLQYLDYLNFLENNRTVRLDTIVAYYKSLEYKNKYYNEESVVHAPSFDEYLAADGLLKPLINASGDYVLTALANYYAPDYFELKASNFGLDIADDSSTAIAKLMVLASLKEPVLLDLKAAVSIDDLSNEDLLNLALAFMMIGDYDSAKDIYGKLNLDEVRQDLLAVLSTSLDKANAAKLINGIISSSPASDYLDFAIIGFFESNEVDLSTKSKVEITVNNETERIDIAPLDIEKRVYYSNDLADLKFKSDDNNLLATYYYQGKISELDTDYVSDIAIGLNGSHAVGGTANLVIDISNLTGEARNGELNIALPSNLKFSATFSNVNGLYLVRNNNEYVKLSLSENYTDRYINIPLYVATPGNYEIEPVVFVHNGEYHLSNNLVVDFR